MTDAEFGAWWRDYREAFPNADSYMAGRDEGGKATLRHWAAALRDVQLRDAMEVTARMVRGDIAAVKQFEIGETPAIVRRHARDIHHAGEISEHRQAEHRAARDRKRYQPDAVLGSMQALAKQLEEMQDAGASWGACDVWLDSQFPSDPSDRRERYRCIYCRDSGLTYVAHQDWISAINAGHDQNYTGPRVACARCNCGAHGGKYQKVPAFNPKEHFLVERESKPSLVDEIREWLQERKLARHGASRSADFDRWNEQEGF